MADTSLAQSRGIMLVSGITLLAGAYLAITPVLGRFDFSSGLTTLNVSLGALIAALAYFRVTIGQRTLWLSALLIALGVITLITPWTMGYQALDSFRIPHLLVGGVVIIAEIISAALRPR